MTFEEFWPRYVLLHRRPATRALHAIGSLAPPLFVALAVARGSAWWLAPIPFVAYGFAWFAHLVVERNRPATWDHFWFSLAADYRMCWLMARGRMGAEVARAEVIGSAGEARRTV
jgi:hypothetical protein